MKKMPSVVPNGFRLGALAVVTVLSAFPASAFNFTESDMLMGFRSPSGSYEFVVNLGRATNFNDFAQANPGGSFAITGYTHQQLTNAFPDLDQPLFWSCFASAITLDTSYPAPYTLWATRARTDSKVKTANWSENTASRQGVPAQRMQGVGANAASINPANPGSSATAILIDAGDSRGYYYQITSGGNFKASNMGSIEYYTGANFAASNLVARSDLYYIPPSATIKPSVYLGYIDFHSDGMATFTAAGPIMGLTSISPTNGPTSGGTMLTLTGSNFVNGATVTFGNTNVPATWVSSSELTVTTPASSSAGKVNVTVVNPAPEGQWSTLANAFTFEAAAVPPNQPILAIGQDGPSNFTISFPSETGVNYQLVCTDVSGLGSTPVASWPAAPGATVLPGTGGSLSYTVTNSQPAAFYAVQAWRP